MDACSPQRGAPSRTPAAVRLVERFFGKRYGLVRRTDTGGEATLMGCVADGECTLAPIIAVGEKPEEDDPCDVNPFGQECTGSGGSGGNDGDGGGGSTGGGDPLHPADAADPCNTGYPVIDSPEVQQGLDQIWKASNPDADLADRREKGGWIVATSTGYTFQAFPDSWSSTSCQIDVPPNVLPPNGMVAMVHTHPYTNGELLTTCGKQEIPGLGSFYVNYGNNPSCADYETMQRLRSIPGVEGLIGIIIDKEKITAYDGSDSPSGQTSMARCGY
jgi:hypothetical protein